MTTEQLTSSRRVLIAAGGTGGHIAPALAVGETVRALFGDTVVVRYVTGSKGIEREVFSAAEEFPDSICCNSAPKISLGGISQFANQGRSMLEAIKLLRAYRPDVVFATGGYVCVPILFAARLLKIPYYLHESNAIPGRVVRFFSRHARAVFVAHEQAQDEIDLDNVHVVGTPVRRMMTEVSREAALRHFGFEADKPILLALGGSQGARAVNEALFDAIPSLVSRCENGLQMIWACGPLNYKSMAQRIEAVELEGLQLRLYDYLREMHLAYAAADLVVSRAGASSLAEITAMGLPSVLVPYPYARDNHQMANAASLERIGAAEVINESRLTGRTLAATASELLCSSARRQAMSDAARSAGAGHCAETIAEWLLDGMSDVTNNIVTFDSKREKATA